MKAVRLTLVVIWRIIVILLLLALITLVGHNTNRLDRAGSWIQTIQENVWQDRKIMFDHIERTEGFRPE